MDTNTHTKKIEKKKIRFLKIRRKILSKRKLVRFILILLLASLIFLGVRLTGCLIKKTDLGIFLQHSGSFLFPQKENLSSYSGRTNLLILGKGGLGHEASDLTDTMMILSVPFEKSRSLTLISLPRDIWIPSIRAKINSAYYWGNEKSMGGGIVLSKSLVEEITGIPIHYAVVLDFSGFIKVIDAVGGVSVEVENSFVDKRFPIPGKENEECFEDKSLPSAKKEYNCRYETVIFHQGIQSMNGETALKFARSRFSEGDEGTDIAREKRQQKVISAIKEKLTSSYLIRHPSKIKDVYKEVFSSLETDMNISDIMTIGRFVMNSRDNVKNYVLGENFLENPPVSPLYDNQYVFIPKGNDWEDVKEWIESLLI